MASPKGRAAIAQSGGWIRSGALPIPALILAVILGIQLGGLSWRYRRQIWLLQGFAVGAAAGFLTGRFSRSSGADTNDPHG